MLIENRHSRVLGYCSRHGRYRYRLISGMLCSYCTGIQDPAQGLFCNLNCMLWCRLVGARSRASLNVVPMEPPGPGAHSCKFIAKPGAGESISSAVF
eukprot:COSAG02_NODE_1715_length_11211_cov_8.483801_9_plen_97_part_00